MDVLVAARALVALVTEPDQRQPAHRAQSGHRVRVHQKVAWCLHACMHAGEVSGRADGWAGERKDRDGETDGWMDGCADGWIDGWEGAACVGGQIVEQYDVRGWTDGESVGKSVGQLVSRVGRQADAWMDG